MLASPNPCRSLGNAVLAYSTYRRPKFDETIQAQVKQEHELRVKKAVANGQKAPKLTAGSYFGKAAQLRAATVVPRILELAADHRLRLVNKSKSPILPN